MIDNYDSFTYNLVHYLENEGAEVIVVRNDIELSELPDHCDCVVISPGPGLPGESGNLLKLIGHYLTQVPILGVCLGMQALATLAGLELYHPERIRHGEITTVSFNGIPLLFNGIESPFKAGLYHSWAVRPVENECYRFDAFSSEDVLMAMSHKKLPVYGVQFHPESVLTDHGREIVLNFLASVK